MSNFRTPRLNEDDSQSSDEKMDTGSESFRSQDTPNSLSDFEDRSLETNVLRLQNPEDPEPSDVLRLSEPCDNIKAISHLKTQKDLNNSLVTKMSNLKINTNENRPENLGISPPKFSSSLVLTTNHPLMGLGSPEFPDVIPKLNEEKDLSLSSIEDERQVELNGHDLYSPQINTSKNNLYFSENFTTAESLLIDSKLDNIPPDVARIEKKERRKIIPKYVDAPKKETILTPHRVLGRIVDSNRDDSAINKYIEERNKKLFRSTPKSSLDYSSDVSEPEFYSGVAEWPEPPSHRPVPTFDLPIELSANVTVNNDLNSPDVISSSTQEDKSAYQALLDPYTGSVALRHTAPRTPNNTTRRKIQLPPEDDRCSLDSLSVSMDSEEEPPEPELQESSRPPSGDESKRSKSSQTGSECSELIPEYSAADELRDERSWLRVRTGGTDAIADMKVIEPYKRVISHGGYDACGAAIIVFSACHLPDHTRTDYRYVMDNLFLYVIWTLEQLVTDEYVLVYLHGSAGKRMPSFRWLQECYKLIDRRLRKSLKHLYLVHPTFWLKSFVLLTKPFVSSKFFRKLSYVRSLTELEQMVPVEPNAIPEMVKQFDARQ